MTHRRRDNARWFMPPMWMESARCAQADPEEFTPEHQGGSTQAAKRICRRCPVREDCLEYALANGEIYFGIWGGMSPRELQAEAKRRKEAADNEADDDAA